MELMNSLNMMVEENQEIYHSISNINLVNLIRKSIDVKADMVTVMLVKAWNQGIRLNVFFKDNILS